MHKVKKHARRAAWYSDDEEGPNYNPFAKHGIAKLPSTSSNGDLESGLARQGRSTSASRPTGQRATSETFVRSEVEATRQSQFRQPRTFSDRQPLPPISSDSQSPRSLNFDIGRRDGADDESPREGQEDSMNTSRTLTGDEKQVIEHTGPLSQVDTQKDPVIHEQGPRQRKNRFRFRKSSGQQSEHGELEPSPSPSKRPQPKFTFRSQIQNTLFNSPINILLIAVPVGIALYAAGADPRAVFAVNFIAIVPLAAMLSYATEEIALRTNETLGGLLNATFGNATELIVSIIALFQDQIIITQTSLIGSMLSNLLLVLGMCFFFGGITRPRQHFNKQVAQTASSLLAIALAGLIVPTIFDIQTQGGVESANITTISRGVAICLLVVYGCYLFFQLHTHADLFNEKSEKEPKWNKQKGEASRGLARMGQMFTLPVGTQVQDNIMPEEEDEEEVPKLATWVAIATLVIATGFIGACSEFMVDGISGLTDNADPNSNTISKTFIGLILVPIVGNAAEHATAVTVACKDKMDLAIGVAVGSSMQIALLVLPLVVVIGWIADKPLMNLDFDAFQVVILFVSILLVNYLIQDGESHWLEGALLMILYIIIAVSSWFYPQPCTPDSLYCPLNGTQ